MAIRSRQKFAEIYLWPCVRYFSSWDELLQQLQSTTDEELQHTSQSMKQANRWRKYEFSSNLCWALERVDMEPRDVPGDYGETMQALYGKIF